MKCLFLIKEKTQSYGISYGLYNSALFISNFIDQSICPSSVVTCIDANDIDREVINYDASHIFIEALWVTPIKLKEIMSLPRHKNRKWIIRLHSCPTFIANEGIAMPWLSEYSQLFSKNNCFFVAPNSEEFQIDLNNIFQFQTLFLPNVYPIREYPNLISRPIIGTRNTINIGCFGAIRPMKNQLTQAIAAIEFANEVGISLKFYINSDRIEQNGNPTYKNIKALFSTVKKHSLIENPWVNHAEFIDSINNMDIGMQCSLNESFNIVSADFINQSIPIITSPEVKFITKRYCAIPTSTESIKEKLILIFDELKNGITHYFGNNSLLQSYNNISKNLWTKFLVS